MRPRAEVWEHFDSRQVQGKREAICKYCGTVYKNALATRLREHINRCKCCPQSVKRMASEASQGPSKKRSTASMTFPSSSTSVSTVASTSTDDTPNINFTVDLAPALTDSEVDEAIARAVYSSAVPLSMLESQFWKKTFELIRPGYDPPNRHSLGGNLLTAEYQRVKMATMKKIQNANGLGLISDGWGDISGRKVVNFIVSTPEPIFYKSLRPGVQRETAAFVASNIIGVIDEIGNDKFVSVITDNAPNMRAAWKIIEDKYKHIRCVGCAAHGINLLIKDIMALNVLDELLQQSKKLIKLFKYSHVPHALLEAKQKEKYGSSACTLKLPSPTRWAYAVLCFDSLLKNKEAILEAIVCPTVQFDRNIKTAVLADDTWEKLEEARRLLRPLFDAINRIETDNAVLSDIHSHFSSISRHVDSVLQDSAMFSMSDVLAIRDSIKKRQELICKPIHAAAHLLDPRYRGVALSGDDENQALNYITEMCNVSGYDRGIMLANLAEFKAHRGFFSRDSLWEAAQHVSPSTWWQGLCEKQPLNVLASKLLNIPPSSAASERNWSAHGRIHTKVRNRLSPSTTEKLIAVQWNLQYRDNPVNIHGSAADATQKESSLVCDESIDTE